MPNDRRNSEYKQTVFSRFSSPKSELDCFLLSVKNMLSNYREKKPDFPVDPSEGSGKNEEKIIYRNLRRLCGHRSRFGPNFSQLEARLKGKLENTSYEVHTEVQADVHKLQEIIREDSASLPLIELNPEYFEEIDEYTVQPGQFGENLIPILLPLLVEDDGIIYWDPLADYYDSTGNVPVEMCISETTFLHLWNNARRPCWILWIDGQEQKTVTEFHEEEQ